MILQEDNDPKDRNRLFTQWKQEPYCYLSLGITGTTLQSIKECLSFTESQKATKYFRRLLQHTWRSLPLEYEKNLVASCHQRWQLKIPKCGRLKQYWINVSYNITIYFLYLQNFCQKMLPDKASLRSLMLVFIYYCTLQFIRLLKKEINMPVNFRYEWKVTLFIFEPISEVPSLVPIQILLLTSCGHR